MKVSEGEMTFLDHLEELRWHIIRSAVAVLVVAVIAFVFKDYIFALLFAPKNGDFFTYQMFCKVGHWFNFESDFCAEQLPFTIQSSFGSYLDINLDRSNSRIPLCSL